MFFLNYDMVSYMVVGRKNRNNILLVSGGILITTFFLLPIISLDFRESFLSIMGKYQFAEPVKIIVIRF